MEAFFQQTFVHQSEPTITSDINQSVRNRDMIEVLDCAYFFVRYCYKVDSVSQNFDLTQ